MLYLMLMNYFQFIVNISFYILIFYSLVICFLYHGKFMSVLLNSIKVVVLYMNNKIELYI